MSLDDSSVIEMAGFLQPLLLPLKRRLRRIRRRLTTYRNLLAILQPGKVARIDDLRRAQSPVLVERGTNDSILIIAFTGGVGKLMVPVFEFFETTKTLGCSRILLRDQYRQYYQRGIDEQRTDFDSLIGYLKDEIARLSPKHVFCIGTSQGGYAAIFAGHLLSADYVHAFSPQTSRDQITFRDSDSGFRLSRLRETLREITKQTIIDLAQVLSQSNGKTTYFIHYGYGCSYDRRHAEHLAGLPRVFLLGYPSAAHEIAIFLAKMGFLTNTLDIARQDKMVEMAKAHFPEAIEISEPPSRPES